MRKNLLQMLIKNNMNESYPFHMPGHKRNVKYMGDQIPYNIDITEINGFDDLHHPEGILEDLNKRVSKLFSSSESCCLINGSTVGNLAAILSLTKPGDKILVARNSHKSVHNAIILNYLEPVYIYPEQLDDKGICGEVKLSDISKVLKAYDYKFKAVVIVSPTYDGVISDVKAIADEVHKYGIPLIVDEAHGAHLGLGEYWENNSNELGADIVVHSIHKTLPSLTQTALLHMNGALVDYTRVKKYLSMLQSSSPSYVLLASIDNCIGLMEDKNFKVQVQTYTESLVLLRNKLREMRYLELIETNRYDYSKIVISTRKTNISSAILMQILRKLYKLELEMDGGTYVVAMTTVADTKEGLDRLESALLEIDRQLHEYVMLQFKNEDEIEDIETEQRLFHYSKECSTNNSENIALLFEQLSKTESITVDTSDSSYYMYPPGIPIILPGESITKGHLDLINQLKDEGYTIHIQ